jgi:ribosomal protein S18 acetylase RimI-like enzyme
MLIREAGFDEIEIVRQIIFEAFKEYDGVLNPPSGALRETVEGIKSKIEGRGGAIIVQDGLEPVGSAIYYFEDDYLYFGRVAVNPSHRNRGIGKEMVCYFEGLAKEKGYANVRIGVRISLPDNFKYYKKLGYVPIEEHEYPEKTDGWYVMMKQV